MRIGIYGGSFNPPHMGHLRAAAAAARYLRLDELLLVPAGIPPHKELSEGTPPAEHRLAMTALMAGQTALMADIPVHVSRMEIDRAGKSYTVDTLRELREQRPGAELWLLMGADMFLTFQDWYKPEEILSYAGICAFDRSRKSAKEALDAQRDALKEAFPAARVRIMTDPDVVEISSSEVREALAAGKGAQYLNAQIYGYILREHLYGTDVDLKHLTIRQLRPIALSYLMARRVRHVLGVESEAVRLAVLYGADVRQARIAALLHDCTKKLNMSEQLALCEQYGIKLDELERDALKLLHAKTGAAIAREVFGADAAVCNAIRWHTTGRAHMSLLEKVIYLADYIEPNRDFDGVEELRAATYMNLDRGLELGLQMSIEELKKKKGPVHPSTREAYEFIKAKTQGDKHGISRLPR